MDRNIKNKNSQKGFTLIEMLVSLFLFSICMAFFVGAFSNVVKTYKVNRELQRNMEQAQFAMNMMAKTLRTSTIIVPATSGSASDITVWDYSQGKCIRYFISGGKLQGGTATTTEAGCSSGAVTTEDFALGVKSGGFEVVRSSNTPVAVGRINVRLEIGTSAKESENAMLQTSVTLRDYDKMK